MKSLWGACVTGQILDMNNMPNQLAEWELNEADVEVLHDANGDPCLLGEGGYGKVRLLR